MSTTENPAEKKYLPGAIIALTIPREPIRGTRLQDESGYICENVGPGENGDVNARWMWKDKKTGKFMHPRMTWAEILSDATSHLTVLPPKFKTGDVITERAQLDLLPAGAVVLDAVEIACQKVPSATWRVAGIRGECEAYIVDLPATILWLPENKEQA